MKMPNINSNFSSVNISTGSSGISSPPVTNSTCIHYCRQSWTSGTFTHQQEKLARMCLSSMMQECYRLKNEFSIGIPADRISRTSPIENMNNAEWEKLVKAWFWIMHFPPKKKPCQVRSTK